MLTLNIPESCNVLDDLEPELLQHITLIENAQAKGFGANHNAALLNLEAEYILAADPDLRLPERIFPALEAHLSQDGAGIASPQAVTPQGDQEDNGRPLFTPWRFFIRNVFGRNRNTRINLKTQTENVDWLAGLFLALRHSTFQQVQGFDTGYFMYCEDIDLCLRIQLLGQSCALLTEHKIVHPPRRGTFRSFQHFRWHLKSLFRLWRSEVYRRYRQGPN